jgi:hypothetical protein
MEPLSKKQVLDNLAVDWKRWIEKIMQLVHAERSLFLQKQGYGSLTALLMHIVAWWEEAENNIRALDVDPNFQPPQYDVDQFNADVISKSTEMTEAEAIHRFEVVRHRLHAFIASREVVILAQDTVQKELFWNITNHFKDHEI